MRISDWSSDVCSSDLLKKYKSDRVDCPSPRELRSGKRVDSKSCDCAFSNCRLPPCSPLAPHRMRLHSRSRTLAIPRAIPPCCPSSPARSEEHTSELQSLMRISYADVCLKKKTNNLQ